MNSFYIQVEIEKHFCVFIKVEFPLELLSRQQQREPMLVISPHLFIRNLLYREPPQFPFITLYRLPLELSRRKDVY